MMLAVVCSSSGPAVARGSHPMNLDAKAGSTDSAGRIISLPRPESSLAPASISQGPAAAPPTQSPQLRNNSYRAACLHQGSKHCLRVLAANVRAVDSITAVK